MQQTDARLVILPTQKGRFVGYLQYEKDGKTKQINVPPQYIFTNADLNGAACTFYSEGGAVKKIVLTNGTVLLDLTRQTAKQPTGGNTFKHPDSFDKTKILHPILRNLNGFTDIDNFSLKLYKATRCEWNTARGRHEFYFFRTYRGQIEYQIRPNYGSTDFTALAARQERCARSLTHPHGNYHTLRFQPDWRLIVGLGLESVYETAITLHHIYGIPYLPASSIKGVVRSWVIACCFNNQETIALQNELFVYLLGSDDKSYDKEQHEGQLLFFDSFPNAAPAIEPDIMNVHYPNYYGGNEAPTDTQSPNPIVFLTVGNKSLSGNDFYFQTIVGVRDNPSLEAIGLQKMGDMGVFLPSGSRLSNKSTVLELATYWLQSALTLHGIGAKTAIGYGYMRG
ncbi:MAG TPA: type III-B CRISPR module RAMP protein Cmr6 [Chitinophagales bacterium]|nr:type III-B CRISPR module RAMP protein Cmr6 [Chitinophagales bacterium]